MSFLSSIFPSSSGTPVNAGNTGIPPATPLAGQQAPAPAPAAPTIPTPPAAPASPLDQYAALWQSATNADGKPIAPSADPLGQPIFNFDPTKITESASRMDFTTGIPAETIQKALGGDAAAFAEAVGGSEWASTVNNAQDDSWTDTANLSYAIFPRVKTVDVGGGGGGMLVHPGMSGGMRG